MTEAKPFDIPKRVTRALRALEASVCERPDTGSRMSREVHVRFWESTGVKLPRATRLPLYRQSQILARQGIELDRSTLCDWVGRACWWLDPLWRLLHRHVLGSTQIFADDSVPRTYR